MGGQKKWLLQSHFGKGIQKVTAKIFVVELKFNCGGFSRDKVFDFSVTVIYFFFNQDSKTLFGAIFQGVWS